MFDIVFAVLSATSDLGNNPTACHGDPLFVLAVVLATLGILGDMLDLVLMLILPWRARVGPLLRRSQLVIWPSWTAGVTLIILNVYLGWF